MKKEQLHIAAAGLGVNTIAFLIECTKMGVVFDAILFADPGSEFKKTYQYIPIINKWLVDNGQPKITIVRQVNKHGDFVGLYNDCIRLKALPSIVYGHKKCSLKFKLQPQEKYLNNWEPTKHLWESGGVVIRYKGYDADEQHRINKDYSDEKYINVHPLIDLNMGLFECVKTIMDAGLPLPPKSSCKFCPSMKPWEIIELYESSPKDFYDAVYMERNAQENLTSVKGLGRDFSWWDLVLAYKYLNLVKRHKSFGNVPVRIKKLMKKVSRSKPIDYEKLASDRISVKESVCDLFKQNIEIPCECVD